MTSRRSLCLSIAAFLSCISCTISAVDTALASEIAFSCQSADGTKTKAAGLICKEFSTALQRSYPGSTIIPATAERSAQAAVTVVNTTQNALALNLTWIGPDGRKVVGETKSVTVMDRKLDAGRRHSLYLRVITANPKPE